jgi:hypothetical protein
MKLLQIVYLSSLVSDDESVLKDILAECKRNNPAKGLTGMLLYTSKQFIQVLEGPENAVTDTYYRVHLDPRHSDLIELLQEPIEHRQFESWSMGFRKLNDKDASEFPEMAPYFRYGFDVDRIKARPGLALELLRNFAQNNQ